MNVCEQPVIQNFLEFWEIVFRSKVSIKKLAGHNDQVYQSISHCNCSFSPTIGKVMRWFFVQPKRRVELSLNPTSPVCEVAVDL